MLFVFLSTFVNRLKTFLEEYRRSVFLKKKLLQTKEDQADRGAEQERAGVVVKAAF